MEPETRPITVRIVRSVREIPRDEWDRLFPPTLEGYAFYLTIEETLAGQFTPYYILIARGEETVCIAPAFGASYPLETTAGPLFRKIVTPLRAIFPRFAMPRVVICGSPTSETKIGLKDTGDQAVATALVQALETIAAGERASIIAFKDFSDAYAPFLAPLSTCGFHIATGLPSVELDLPFRSFDDYTASLSAKTRLDLRRKFKKADAGAITMEIRTELGDLLDDAYALYRNTLNKSEMQFEIMTKEFFRRIPAEMPAETRFFIWRVDGKLAAFHFCLASKDIFVAQYLGFDYDLAYRYHLYFVVFRDEITWCIQNGIPKYESGALNYDPKKRLDFTFVPQYLYIRHRNRFINKPFGLLVNLLEPAKDDPILKEMRASGTLPATGRTSTPPSRPSA